MRTEKYCCKCKRLLINPKNKILDGNKIKICNYCGYYNNNGIEKDKI